MRYALNTALSLLLLISTCASALAQAEPEDDGDAEALAIANSGLAEAEDDGDAEALAIANSGLNEDESPPVQEQHADPGSQTGQEENRSLDRKCTSFDLSAEKSEFLEKLENLLSPTQQQKNQLSEALSALINKLAINSQTPTETEETPYVPEADPNALVCGEQMECVELWRCKNTTKEDDKNYVITFRTSYRDCYYNQICCQISDKLPNINPPPLEDMLPCGHRNENGIRMEVKEPRSNEANYAEFPWMVAILVEDLSADIELPLTRVIGGGSLLAPNIVMTAGHKVKNESVEDLKARAGEWDRSVASELYKHETIGVQEIIVHPNFTLWQNNIALLVLKKPFEAQPHVYPVCLPNPDINIDFSNCFTMGWGKFINATPRYPNILKKISLAIVPRNECLRKIGRYLNRQVLHPSYICAGGEKNVDACLGDGGAPLVCPVAGLGNPYYQVGIVAWGVGCGKQDVPAVYTNVALLKPWITQELNHRFIDAKYYTA